MVALLSLTVTAVARNQQVAINLPGVALPIPASVELKSAEFYPTLPATVKPAAKPGVFLDLRVGYASAQGRPERLTGLRMTNRLCQTMYDLIAFRAAPVG
jgi:hypothetical protein